MKGVAVGKERGMGRGERSRDGNGHETKKKTHAKPFGRVRVWWRQNEREKE